MSALVFVDTAVLLHAVDARDTARQAAARLWLQWCWTERAGRISTQVLNEFYHNACTRFDAAQVMQSARAQVRALRQWQPPHLDRYTVDGAWALQDRYQLGYWDALILASAQQQGCRYVLSEAFAHLQSFDALQVLHPMAVAPQQLGSLEKEAS